MKRLLKYLHAVALWVADDVWYPALLSVSLCLCGCNFLNPDGEDHWPYKKPHKTQTEAEQEAAINSIVAFESAAIENIKAQRRAGKTNIHFPLHGQ